MPSCEGTIVLTPRQEGVLAINRDTLKAVTFPSETEIDLKRILCEANGSKPEWFIDAMQQIGVEREFDGMWGEKILLRERPQMDVRRIAWEITERCNFRCVHCYLDERKHSGVNMEERLLLLDKFQQMGCLWLQLTGGEALADPLFEQTYKAAWQRGFMITILTNGMFLSKWIDLFKKYPPKILAVSLYGASGQSYSEMAKTPPSAFRTVFEGIERAHRAGIRLRVSIVGSKHNKHEISIMEKMLEDKGIQHHTFLNLVPTIGGNAEPMKHAANVERPKTFFLSKGNCAGGEKALHVYSTGKASPCKILPHISVNLLTDNIQDIDRMKHHAGTKKATRGCDTCPSSKQCTTCGPIYALHKTARHIPSSVCRWY